jgi:glutamate/tyrosine decarboxylase-like PLP-dependent enzyme
VYLNCGTTVGHAVDNIEEASEIINDVCNHYGTKYWVHVDAAFFGSVLPFVD